MTKEKHNPQLRRQIDENLKRAYQQELEREVPDRFHALLEQLRQQEGQQPGGDQ